MSRSRCTRSSVRADCGPVVGTTVNTAVVPSGLTVAGVTAATPEVDDSAPCTCCKACSPPPAGRSATMSSGPFEPGPNAAAWVSYAVRVDVASRLLPASGKPKRTPRNGAARASRITTPAAAATMRCRSTSRLQPSQARDGSTCPPTATDTSWPRPRGSRSRSTCRPR